ncbi:HAMP domain-containing sensor histidine kinase [Sulfurimonas sp. HSL3-7]|uniref:sensor histidine kinase n=1 Tax=Sulfonitrofixus jiaomeiensis TaxID=3131938 RepID=UPI0031F97DB3
MFNNIILSALLHPVHASPGIEKTRVTFLNLLLLFAILILGFDLYNSVTYEFMLMAYAETLALLVLITTYLLSRRNLPFMAASYLLVGTVAFMAVFALTVEGYGKESALFWTASLPIYVFLLLGTCHGLRVSALILAGIVWSTANAYYLWIAPIFEFDVLIQMALGYTAITLSVYYFEKMRSGYEVELSKALEEREALYEELNGQKDQIETSNRELAQKIDEVKEQENMLIAQSRLAAMGEMMSMIAHQWRQPLSTMSLMIANYNVKAMIGDRPKDERDKILEEVSVTLQYLSETVEDFQTYFKPTNTTESSSIRAILERAAEFTKTRLQFNNITLLNNCTDGYMIHTHSNEMVQVVINIINNAVDAIVQNGSQQREIRIDTEERPEHIILRISDTGGGIDEAIIDRIFEPYYSTKSKNGTGLGLYMAKMIVAKHNNGEIDAANNGGGCTFTLKLPKI